MHPSHGLEQLSHDSDVLSNALVLNSVSNHRSHDEIERFGWLDTCTTDSSRNALDQARCFSEIPEPVMVVGECGTGRSAFARQIHQWGRSDLTKMRIVFCGAWNSFSGSSSGNAALSLSQFLEMQTESESTPWLFENVDEIPSNMQSCFLQAVEGILQRQDHAVGPTVVTTAGPSILKSLNSGGFRKDLYYRLSVLQLELPLLRERCADLEKLISYFQASRPSRNQGYRFNAEVVEQMADYDWPGNLVELRNVVTRVLALAGQSIIDIDELRKHWLRPRTEFEISGMSLEDAETQLIMQALERFQGNKTAAANQLGITTRTLHNKVRKFRSLGLM